MRTSIVVILCAALACVAHATVAVDVAVARPACPASCPQFRCMFVDPLIAPDNVGKCFYQLAQTDACGCKTGCDHWNCEGTGDCQSSQCFDVAKLLEERKCACPGEFVRDACGCAHCAVRPQCPGDVPPVDCSTRKCAYGDADSLQAAFKAEGCSCDEVAGDECGCTVCMRKTCPTVECFAPCDPDPEASLRELRCSCNSWAPDACGCKVCVERQCDGDACGTPCASEVRVASDLAAKGCSCVQWGKTTCGCPFCAQHMCAANDCGVDGAKCCNAACRSIDELQLETGCRCEAFSMDGCGCKTCERLNCSCEPEPPMTTTTTTRTMTTGTTTRTMSTTRSLSTTTARPATLATVGTRPTTISSSIGVASPAASKKRGIVPTTVCTADARQCPDGSWVGRSGPNCAFADCPAQRVCTDDVQRCADGSFVGRDAAQGCAFKPCPTRACTDDVFTCDDGTQVPRDPSSCEFMPCPRPAACTRDAMVCPDGSSVGRDPYRKCEFYPCPGAQPQSACRTEDEVRAALAARGCDCADDAWVKTACGCVACTAPRCGDQCATMDCADVEARLKANGCYCAADGWAEDAQCPKCKQCVKPVCDSTTTPVECHVVRCISPEAFAANLERDGCRCATDLGRDQCGCPTCDRKVCRAQCFAPCVPRDEQERRLAAVQCRCNQWSSPDDDPCGCTQCLARSCVAHPNECDAYVCRPPPCAAPPTGCQYDRSTVTMKCGCPTDCGQLKCAPPTCPETCPMPPCAAPHDGCRMVNVTRNDCGCQVDCGVMTCVNDPCLDAGGRPLPCPEQRAPVHVVVNAAGVAMNATCTCSSWSSRCGCAVCDAWSCPCEARRACPQLLCAAPQAVAVAAPAAVTKRGAVVGGPVMAAPPVVSATLVLATSTAAAASTTAAPVVRQQCRYVNPRTECGCQVSCGEVRCDPVCPDVQCPDVRSALAARNCNCTRWSQTPCGCPECVATQCAPNCDAVRCRSRDSVNAEMAALGCQCTRFERQGCCDVCAERQCRQTPECDASNVCADHTAELAARGCACSAADDAWVQDKCGCWSCKPEAMVCGEQPNDCATVKCASREFQAADLAANGCNCTKWTTDACSCATCAARECATPCFAPCADVESRLAAAGCRCTLWAADVDVCGCKRCLANECAADDGCKGHVCPALACARPVAVMGPVDGARVTTKRGDVVRVADVAVAPAPSVCWNTAGERDDCGCLTSCPETECCRRDCSDMPQVKCAAVPAGCALAPREANQCNCTIGCPQPQCPPGPRCAPLIGDCDYVDGEKDACGCVIGCPKPAPCPQILCARPPEGCHYSGGVPNQCGCTLNCGELICETSSSTVSTTTTKTDSTTSKTESQTRVDCDCPELFCALSDVVGCKASNAMSDGANCPCVTRCADVVQCPCAKGTSAVHRSRANVCLRCAAPCDGAEVGLIVDTKCAIISPCYQIAATLRIQSSARLTVDSLQARVDFIVDSLEEVDAPATTAKRQDGTLYTYDAKVRTGVETKEEADQWLSKDASLEQLGLLSADGTVRSVAIKSASVAQPEAMSDSGRAGDSGLSSGAVAGIVIGCIVLLLLVVAGIVLLVCVAQRRSRQTVAPVATHAAPVGAARRSGSNHELSESRRSTTSKRSHRPTSSDQPVVVGMRGSRGHTTSTTTISQPLSAGSKMDTLRFTQMTSEDAAYQPKWDTIESIPDLATYAPKPTRVAPRRSSASSQPRSVNTTMEL